MPALIVLFNLKDASAHAAYEKWAQTTDVPNVKGLSSVDDFKVYRLTGILGTDQPAPYAYCEVIDINDMNGLFADISTDTMKQVAAEFQAFADNPMFIVSEQFA
jgi:REDY-like protein HapK